MTDIVTRLMPVYGHYKQDRLVGITVSNGEHTFYPIKEARSADMEEFYEADKLKD